MRQLAVISVATGVLRSDLMQMRHLRGEPIRASVARVRGKADTCAFTVDCTCGLKVNYTDDMIYDTLLNGIADDVICREILGSADVLTRAVNEIVALVEFKEMARNAVPLTEVTSVSAIQHLHHADHRAHRNATPSRESHNLPARVLVKIDALSALPATFLALQKWASWLEYQTLPCVLNATGHTPKTPLRS